MNELNLVRLGNTSTDPFEVQEIEWWNCSHNNINQKTEEEIERLSGRLYGFADWENMVEFWYSIRNNLFHGTKDPEMERNRLLIVYGYKTLRPLVKLLIDKYFPERIKILGLILAPRRTTQDIRRGFVVYITDKASLNCKSILFKISSLCVSYDNLI